MRFLIETAKLGLSNLRLRMLRSILTALGIILGVAAVITNGSLGEGSKQEALREIQRLGAQNIIIRSQQPPDSAARSSQQQTSFISRYGITRDTLAVIQANFPDATHIVPLKAVGGQIMRQEFRKTSQAFGTTPEMIEVANIPMARGRYLTPRDLEDEARVAVIGSQVAKDFFAYDDPIGQTMMIDQKPVTVIGVFAPVGTAGGAGVAQIGRDINLDVHIPLTTAVTNFGDMVVRSSSGNMQAAAIQISEIYIQSPTMNTVMTDAARLRRIIDIRHPTRDVAFIVPYELLETAKATARRYNLVFGAVAGISLLVGGIGIMNIMLASVTERTREIGIRRAIGATRRHILTQFLVETGVLSGIGGVVGVTLGVGLSLAVPAITQWTTDKALPSQVTGWSIVLSFAVATMTGLIFGIYPARRAAAQDPIESLRHD
jgi:putative ABC transport system permease protein